MTYLWFFFNSSVGSYVVQTVLHAAVAAAVADGSILAWKISNPRLRQRLRLIVIFIPCVSFPAYQLLDPSRGSLPFRLGAVFDSARWVSFDIILPAGFFFIAVLLGTALVFLLQEMLPIVRHTIATRSSPPEPESAAPSLAVDAALEGLSVDIPPVHLLETDEPLMFSSTGRHPAVYASRGLVGTLGRAELRAAIAHEIAHIKRSRTPLLTLVFLLRILMFYNPVTLMEFRKVIQEEERICDDMAVAMTGEPAALAAAIDELRRWPPSEGSESGRIASAASALERSSHDLLLRNRIGRLRHGSPTAHEEGWFPVAAALVVTVALNYFIV